MMIPTNLPPIFVTSHDHGRLGTLATRCAERRHPVASFLLSELGRATVCRPEDIPDDTVTMNCRVIYRIDNSRNPESRVLVYPADYSPHGGQISVLSPVGAALLGLRAGSQMPYRTLGGAENCLTVEEVSCRPQATIVPFRRRRVSAPWEGPGPDGAA